ncbi:hypothetical protein PUN28_014817 [Cardiocondyla obscurior]|uniref:Uncharacterized protein n=1 Tax=Cardiocondyla obscurior TaxID=286306 RepID=A0AAW2EVL6_9HYME
MLTNTSDYTDISTVYLIRAIAHGVRIIRAPRVASLSKLNRDRPVFSDDERISRRAMKRSNGEKSDCRQ